MSLHNGAMLQFVTVIALLLNFFGTQTDARAVNVSNTWTMPQEGLNVFYRFFRDRISWFEADAVCQFHHANLVTVDNSFQFDATRDLLRELDVNDIVWIGLMRPQSSERFMWSNSRPLVTDTGYWAESLPLMDAPLCAVIDPIRDYRWHALRCGGPETASFLCEMPVPAWADACILKDIPNLTMQYMADTASIELIRNCAEEGLLKQSCKGKKDRDRALRELICPRERLEAQRINDITNSHFKSLQIINNIRTDNNENNNIELLPLGEASYSAASSGDISEQVPTEKNTVQRLIEQFNVDDLMQADEPSMRMSGYHIPDEIPKPVKKSPKKVIIANSGIGSEMGDYPKKNRAMKYDEKLQLPPPTPKPNKQQQQQQRLLALEDMMMGDQPQQSGEPEMLEHVVIATEDDEVSNEIMEPLPHKKKVLPQYLKTMPPILEKSAEEVEKQAHNMKKAEMAKKVLAESAATTASVPAASTTVLPASTAIGIVETTTTGSATTTTTATTTTAEQSSSSSKPNLLSTTVASRKTETEDYAEYTRKVHADSHAEMPTSSTTTAKTDTHLHAIELKPHLYTWPTWSAPSSASSYTTSSYRTSAPTSSSSYTTSAPTSSSPSPSALPISTHASYSAATTSASEFPTATIGHPMHPQQQQHGIVTEEWHHQSHVAKETADYSHFIPPMLFVKSHYVSPLKHNEQQQQQHLAMEHGHGFSAHDMGVHNGHELHKLVAGTPNHNPVHMNIADHSPTATTTMSTTTSDSHTANGKTDETDDETKMTTSTVTTTMTAMKSPTAEAMATTTKTSDVELAKPATDDERTDAPAGQQQQQEQGNARQQRQNSKLIDSASPTENQQQQQQQLQQQKQTVIEAKPNTKTETLAAHEITEKIENGEDTTAPEEIIFVSDLDKVHSTPTILVDTTTTTNATPATLTAASTTTMKSTDINDSDDHDEHDDDDNDGVTHDDIRKKKKQQPVKSEPQTKEVDELTKEMSVDTTRRIAEETTLITTAPTPTTTTTTAAAAKKLDELQTENEKDSVEKRIAVEDDIATAAATTIKTKVKSPSDSLEDSVTGVAASSLQPNQPTVAAATAAAITTTTATATSTSTATRETPAAMAVSTTTTIATTDCSSEIDTETATSRAADESSATESVDGKTLTTHRIHRRTCQPSYDENKNNNNNNNQRQQKRVPEPPAPTRNFLKEETETPPYKPNRRRVLTKPETESYFKKIIG